MHKKSRLPFKATLYSKNAHNWLIRKTEKMGKRKPHLLEDWNINSKNPDVELKRKIIPIELIVQKSMIKAEYTIILIDIMWALRSAKQVKYFV